jgi:methylenetetrahydrofolate dehydrogenase (NADP+) / methenyltetrahydrofolate cyclohydrolase
MKTVILNGKSRAAELLLDLKGLVERLVSTYNVTPKLAIILVGDNIQSSIYVRNKLARAREVGILAEVVKFDANCPIESVLNSISRLNIDPSVHAIIVQSPLPSGWNFGLISQAIAPEKDVDGLHPLNVGKLASKLNQGFVPCTALACLELARLASFEFAGKLAVVVGRSNIVGRPLGQLLLNNDATVVICHRHTSELKEITTQGDLVVLATGQPKYFTKDYFKPGSIVLDVGISKVDGQLFGDVDFASLIGYVSYITPVPGGVGPMTIAYLLSNTVQSFRSHLGLN